MWAGIIALATKLFGIFFPAKDERDVAHSDGLAEGTAQQKASDESAVIKDVSDAKTASNSVDTGIADGVSVIQSDGFRRD